MECKVDPGVLTDKEAAQYIGMSESWLRISRMKGSLDTPPFLKIGRSVRYLKQDLDNWLLKQRRINTLGQAI
jgi:predicted DNA-binding transcriptional regulator AlpA